MNCEIFRDLLMQVSEFLYPTSQKTFNLDLKQNSNNFVQTGAFLSL